MKTILFLFLIIFFGCSKDDPVSTTTSPIVQPDRVVQYAFSGSSGYHSMEYLIENNGFIVEGEAGHYYPYITDPYTLKKGNHIFVTAKNTSLISPSSIRITVIVDNDTMCVKSGSGNPGSISIDTTLN